VRFETAPGKQLQIDFGERLVEIAGGKVKVFLFVATLGYSRRLHVRAFRNERQESWFAGLESAFARFGGVTDEVLFDNARALVVDHDAVTRSVVFNDRLLAFAKWIPTPSVCAISRSHQRQDRERRRLCEEKRRCRPPLRNLGSLGSASGFLDARGCSDTHSRHDRGDADQPLRTRGSQGAEADQRRPPFRATRELIRRVGSDCTVEVDGNAYSVPWRLIGDSVLVTVTDTAVRIHHAGREVAVHAALNGSRQRAIDPAHYAGVAGANGRYAATLPLPPEPAAAPASLVRDLGEYEALLGGGF
jgi:Integrase core domain